MLDKLGGPETYNHYPVGWRHAMDTPFQWTKQVAHNIASTNNGCRTQHHWTSNSRISPFQSVIRIRHLFQGGRHDAAVVIDVSRFDDQLVGLVGNVDFISLVKLAHYLVPNRSEPVPRADMDRCRTHHGSSAT
jgi:hypothetical protein